MDLKTRQEFKKAFEYLRKRGYEYFCDWLWDGEKIVGETATFAEVRPQHVEHVRKTYPNAAIIFADGETVSHENGNREKAFARATGRDVWETAWPR